MVQSSYNCCIASGAQLIYHVVVNVLYFPSSPCCQYFFSFALDVLVCLFVEVLLQVNDFAYSIRRGC